MEVPGSIGLLLRRWRERALMTQEQLAERAGLSVRTVRRWESDATARPHTSSLRLLAAALRLDEAEQAELAAAAHGVDDPSVVVSLAGEVLRQLPAPPPGFIGRRVELAALDRAQDPSAVVVIAIDGMPGVGKTALAVHGAHQLAAHYPDGHIFMDLHGYTEGVPPVGPSEALGRVLAALGVPGPQIPPHVDDRAALFRSRLADRKVLVVLDNASDEAQVAPLLPGTPGSLVLVTSRRRLVGLDGTRTLSLDVLPVADAAALFASSAGEQRAGAAPDVVAEVAELSGRLPLAVRIAAARLRSRASWTVDDLVRKLRNHRRRLVELESGQRSLTAALDLSYQELDLPVRRAYRLLGLHPGIEFDIGAVAALIGTEPVDAERLLVGLLDVHLLQEPVVGRYEFHDLVRAHAAAAAARDEAGPDRWGALTRLLDHFRDTAAAAMIIAYPHVLQRHPHVRTAGTAPPTFVDAGQAVTWLDVELPNLIAAARHAAEHDQSDHLSQLSAILHLHLYTKDRYADAEVLHELALAAAQRAGNGVGEANALICLAEIRSLQGRRGEAVDLYERALTLARAAGGHHRGEADALVGLGYAHLARHAFARAADDFGRAREVARRTGDRATEQEAHFGMGNVHMLQGEPAVDDLESGLAIARAADDRTGELHGLRTLGNVHRLDGRYEQAIDCFERALTISRDLGSPRGDVACLHGLGRVLRSQGHFEQAVEHHRRALEIAREIGNRNWEFESVHELGRIDCATGFPERAMAYHQQALELATELGQPADQARAHDGLAHAHRALHQQEAARWHWQCALDILTALGADVTEDDEATAVAIRAHLADLSP